MKSKSMYGNKSDAHASLARLVVGMALLGLLVMMWPVGAQAATALRVPVAGASDDWWRAGIVAHLGARLPVAGARIEVVNLTLPASAKGLPAGTIVEISEQLGWMRSSRVSLRVDVRFADGSRRNTWVAVRLRLPIAVPVAAERIQRGDRIDPAWVVFEEVDFFSLRGRRPLTATDLEEDISAARTIAAGDPLTVDTIRRTPVVKQGQRIGLLVRRGALTLRTLGIARKTAAAGEVIPISNVDTGKIVVARVLDGETALVEGPGGVR